MSMTPSADSLVFGVFQSKFTARKTLQRLMLDKPVTKRTSTKTQALRIPCPKTSLSLVGTVIFIARDYCRACLLSASVYAMIVSLVLFSDGEGGEDWQPANRVTKQCDYQLLAPAAAPQSGG